jgi:hypothetical protein
MKSTFNLLLCLVPMAIGVFFVIKYYGVFDPRPVSPFERLVVKDSSGQERIWPAIDEISTFDENGNQIFVKRPDAEQIRAKFLEDQAKRVEEMKELIRKESSKPGP